MQIAAVDAVLRRVEGPIDAQAFGGRPAADIADHQIPARAAGVGQLDAVAGGVQGRADGQPTAIYRVQDILNAGRSRQIDVCRFSSAIRDRDGSERYARAAVQRTDKHGIDPGDDRLAVDRSAGPGRRYSQIAGGG